MTSDHEGQPWFHTFFDEYYSLWQSGPAAEHVDADQTAAEVDFMVQVLDARESIRCASYCRRGSQLFQNLETIKKALLMEAAPAADYVIQ